MSALTLLRESIRTLTRRERGLRLMVAISGIGPRDSGQNHIAWAVVDRNWTRAAWLKFYRDTCAAYAQHHKFRFVLHITRHSCASFGDRKLDITGALQALDLNLEA